MTQCVGGLIRQKFTLIFGFGCSSVAGKHVQFGENQQLTFLPSSRGLSENTGLPAYSDSAGTAEKCHCKRVSLYPMNLRTRRFFSGPKNCHLSQSVALTGVTVSGRTCKYDHFNSR